MFRKLIRKKHFRTLLAQLRGAKKLRERDAPFFVVDTVSSLTDVPLGLKENDFPKILVGTQMIAKGLDFPNVNLVGVINADTALHFPDFRAAERTFQLITQVAGRAGRGERPGDVYVQTYNQDHYAVQCAIQQNFQEEQ